MGTGQRWVQTLVRDRDGKRRAWAAPIPWLAGLTALAAVGVGGIFGGLAPVEKVILTGDETTVIDAGVARIGVEKAVVFDEAEELNVTLAEDEDLLLLRVRVTSGYDEPIFASSLFSPTYLGSPELDADEPAKTQILRVPDLATRPILMQRLDTTETPSIVLQPNVSTTLAVGFIIPATTDMTQLSVQVDKVTTFQFVFLGDGEDYGVESGGHLATVTLPVVYDRLTP